MNLSDVKARIEPLSADALDAAMRRTDGIRGWVQCAGINGPTIVQSTAPGAGVERGLLRADALADEGVGAVIAHVQQPVSDLVRAIAGSLCGVDATRVTPPGASDIEWMKACMRVRDLQAAHRSRLPDALDLVDAPFAAVVGLLLGLAARKTPTLLVGPATHAAAVIAQRQSMAAATWWQSAMRDADPLVDVANERLRYEPWWSGRTEVSADVVDALIVGTIASATR